MIAELELHDNHESNKILIKKHNFSLKKIIKNKYQLEYVMENNNIYLDKIINFDFIKLMYESNKNYFELVHMDIIDDNEAYIYMLVKPILKELGIVQRYVALRLTKYAEINSNKIFFKGIPCPEYGKKINNCNNAVLFPIREIHICCNIVHSHKLHIQKTFSFEDSFSMPLFFEKIFGNILKEIYNQIIKVVESIK
jgi:hypothetical protein